MLRVARPSSVLGDRTVAHGAAFVAMAGLSVVPALLLLPVGMRRGHRLRPERFGQFIVGLLLISALKLFHDGVTGLL